MTIRRTKGGGRGGRNGGGRNKDRNRLMRSRQLDRHTEKQENFMERLRRSAARYERQPKSAPPPPCLDCGCYQRDRRLFVVGRWRWAPHCTSCWLNRGRPTIEESFRDAEKLAAESERQAETARLARVKRGESPW